MVSVLGKTVGRGCTWGCCAGGERTGREREEMRWVEGVLGMAKQGQVSRVFWERGRGERR